VDLPTGIREEALAQPTRARIFAYLVERRSAASTGEIAQALDLHPNGVRRHLDRLAAAGLLERGRHRGQRGRPSDRWSIAVSARPGGERPRSYANLARWLARAIPADPSREDEVERAGREIGREIAPTDFEDATESFRETISALGFEPVLDVKADGGFTCKLTNCPFRDSVRENPDIVCTLHRGMTAGLLSRLAPEAELAHFQPHDPERAGCTIDVVPGGSG
jgi:predicted ArsR family transcriptional regulator